MEYRNRVEGKHIVIIVSVFVAVILLVGLLFYFHRSKTSEVEGIVQYVGDGYVLLEDSNDITYKIETLDKYKVNDKLLVVMKGAIKNSSLVEGEAISIVKLSQEVTYQIKDEEVSNNTYQDSGSSNYSQSNSQNSSIDSEEQVVSYFEELNSRIDSYNGNQSIASSIKSGFVSIVDFLFYGGMLKGYTFLDLSDGAKIKVLKLGMMIDSKIESKFPGYKESISSTGSKIITNVKAKAIEAYLDITVTLYSDREDLCTTAKEGLGDLKKNFSLTWDFIKDISGVGLTKLKNWYEVWREV